jgi:hypothetical protein
MNISIKQFDVRMDIKNNGIELDVFTPSDEHIGDLVVNKKGLIWCRGKTSRKYGVLVTWKDFIKWMES